MLPSISISLGTVLYYFKGGQAKILGKRIVSDPDFTSVNSSDYTINSTYPISKLYGGYLSSYPGSCNHRPGAFYRNKFYIPVNRIDEQYSALYILKYDGSGMFVNQGGYSSAPWKSGRGYEFVSPSGQNETSFHTAEMSALNYNDKLFILGQVSEANVNSTTNNWIKKCGWTVSTLSEGGLSPGKRRYRSFVIKQNILTNKEDKIIGSGTTFTPAAARRDYLHACDAIGFKGDIYYANWVDILKFHGPSGGQITLLDNRNSKPSSKCFAIYPTSGYILNNPIGNANLFCLSGSGLINKINASGVEVVYDLKWKNPDVRITSNCGRIETSDGEPGRSSLLINFNKKLHAFITTETSGYHHFVCTGNPGSGINWEDKTQSLPEDLRRWDGNIYGYVDSFRNKLAILHSTMSEVDLFGYVGAQKGAGGEYIYECDASSSGKWELVYGGVIGHPSNGLIPYQNLGPNVTIPSGNNPKVYQASDYAIINYTVYDHYRRNVNVDILYSKDDGLTWNNARRFKSYDNGILLGSGISNLPTSPEGINYDFYWDYVNDVGFNTIKNCMLKIRPSLSR